MTLFGKRRNGLLGLDIGSTSVKVLELSASNGSYRLEGYALEALPPNAVLERNIRDVGEVGEAIKRAVARSGCRASRAVLAVGGAAVTARNVAMEASLSDAEVEARIAKEAERYVPYPLDEVAIDFEVRSLSEQSCDQADVLVVGCHRQNLDNLYAALAAAGLKPGVVEPEFQAVERLFEHLKPPAETQVGESVCLVADFGGTATNLWVLVDGRTVFTRELAVGGTGLIEAIQRHSSLQCPEAEAASRACGFREDLFRAVLGPFNEEAARQLSRALRMFYSSTQYRDLDHVMLIGGAACTSGLAEAVQDALGAPTAVADPFAHMSRARRIDAAAMDRDVTALALTCGLAMRDLQ